MPPDALYRAEIFARYPIGAGFGAVVLRRALAPFVVPEQVAAALETLRLARPVEAHKRAAAASLRDPSHVAMACRLLEEWAGSGVLVSFADVLEAARRSAPASSPTDVRTIGVLTRDRPAALRTCIESFASDAREHGSPCRFVVADDARSPDARAATVLLLRRSATDLGLTIAYAGADERRAFAAALARRAGVDPAIAAFALEGAAGLAAIGANRNALLLACVDEAFLSADDDTQARVGRLDEADDGVRFMTSDDPMEYRFFATRGEAVASVAATRESILGAHAAVLGRSLASIVAACPPEAVDLGGATAATLSGVESGQARVAATIAGVYGDSGMFGGAGFVMHWIRDGRPRYGPDDYRLAVGSREILRVVPRLTLAHGPPFMSTSMGLDFRGLLPPFLPVLRDEDGVFGETLARCFEDGHVAHLPRAVLHAAEPGRRYEPDRVEAARVRRLADVLVLCARATPFGTGVATPEARLRLVGRYVEDLGSASPADYLSAVRSLYLSNVALRARLLETALRSAQGAPAQWTADARASIDAMREAITTDAYYVPFDLRADRPLDAAVALAQEILRAFGQLLQSWPEMVTAARALKSEGVLLARNV